MMKSKLILRVGLMAALVLLVGMPMTTTSAQAASHKMTSIPKALRGTWYYRDSDHYQHKTVIAKKTVKLTTWYRGKSQGITRVALTTNFNKANAVILERHQHGWYTMDWTQSNMAMNYKRGAYKVNGKSRVALYTGSIGVGYAPKKVKFNMAMHQKAKRVYTKKVSIKGIR